MDGADATVRLGIDLLADVRLRQLPADAPSDA
jgi:hypothetical protein